MGVSKPLWASPRDYLKAFQPDVPVFFFAPEILSKTAATFQKGFTGQVTYAVKANPDPTVLENLIAAGITAFDVASPAEFQLLRDLAPDATLHYHNPVRSRREIAEALAHGITSFSVDRISELEKLADLATGQNIEISVRLALPVEGAAYHFGEKFGAAPDEAKALLTAVVAQGFTPSMTFHPGTQCKTPNAWKTYILACADIAKACDISLSRLNVGGGFPSHRRADAPDLDPIFDIITRIADTAFNGAPPHLVCEPGRTMVADAFSLATRVKAIGPRGEVFLNDGIYGGLAELPSIEATDRIETLDARGNRIPGPSSARQVFGPTCDSLDVLPGKPTLPDQLREDDYVILHGTGAYAAALATGFNGYGQHVTATVRRLS